jgi:methyl-accepting chemotaxis protein
MFQQMKVGTRLVLGFFVLVLLGAIVAGIGIYNMDQMDARAKRMYQNELLGVSYMKEANIDLIYIGRAVRGIMLAPNEPQRTKNLGNLDRYKQMMLANLDKARPLFTTEDGKRRFAEFDAQLKDYDNLIAEQLKLAKAEPVAQSNPSIDYLFATFMPRSQVIDDKMTDLARLKEEYAQKSNQENTRDYESSRVVMLVLVLLSALAGGALGMLITRSLMRQLGGEPTYATAVATRIADGDLASDVVLRTGDRSSLLFAMKTMRHKLATIVSEVRHGTDTIASASGQIANGNLDLSARTEEQASSLEETASSMEELTSTVKQNADNARQANALAQTASDVASQGGAVVAQVVQTMGSISESSRQIVDIITVIDGIAFQTNILALNAAVEAARAGEQGRGFAVVAGEVRTLAQRSAAAAKEIKQLIDNSVENVATGTQLVDQAGTTMHEVVSSIQRVTDIMAEISAASQEQTAGIEQVNQAIIQMDTVTQQNAGLVEEAAAASEAMQSEAAKLAGLVSVFQINAGQAHIQQATVTGKPAAAPVAAAARPSLPAPARGAAGNPAQRATKQSTKQSTKPLAQQAAQQPAQTAEQTTAAAQPSAKSRPHTVKPAASRPAPGTAAKAVSADEWEEF